MNGADEKPAAGGKAREARGDRLLLFALLLLLTAAAALTPIRNYDYWWHLETGSLVLAQRDVPRSDPYSFTATGAPWVDHEWLAQIVMYLLHTAAGPGGLVTLKAGLILGLCLLAAARARREGHGPAGTAILLAVALVGASFRLDVRPELATVLLLPLIVELVIRARDTGRDGLLLSVPLLVALGSNLHVGAILAPVLLLPGALLTWAGERLPSRLFPRVVTPPATRWPPFAPRLLLTAAASALAVGANPYGYRIYAVPFELRRLLASLPSPNLEWARPRLADFPLYWLSAAAVFAVVLAARRRIDPIATPVLLCAGILAAAHLRNIGLFFVLLPFGLARPGRALIESCERLWARSIAPAPGGVRPGFVIGAVVLVVAVPALTVLPPAYAWGPGMAAGNEPAAAVDFLEREGIGDRLYNDVKFGGYLIWRRSPGHRVFIDGRNEIYPDLLRDVFESLGDSRTWEAFLSKYGIDAAFLRYSPALERVVRPSGDGRPPSFVERAFSANHFPRESWALVYWDDDAMIVARRSAKNSATIERHEYRAIHPEDWRYLYAGVVTGHVPVGPILDELDRKLREDPGCGLARALRARFGRLAGQAQTRPGAPGAGG